MTFPPQHQDKQLGLQYLMVPRPVSILPNYKPVGKLKAQKHPLKNPLVRDTLLAINEVTKEYLKLNPEFLLTKPQDYGRFLVLSLGTGHDVCDMYNAKEAAKWGMIGWFSSKGRVPIIDTFMQASADMVDIHVAVMFQVFQFFQFSVSTWTLGISRKGFRRLEAIFIVKHKKQVLGCQCQSNHHSPLLSKHSVALTS
eukprot:Gb_15791 [translate_table: standard]